ncbi:hypothetical protein [Sphingosinicella sp. LY1275]|uniref:hypothetical protein n=1 Tax=Sphingosinicella sp. LY1275 TaxID=3095379 RepID=UPI002ADEB60D|nr:hypothetical protein [Sphingosinicella sp. LY1275]MEA1015591.1 hypothetical protein [Sphingosinicella sp. LY1275]
MPAFEERRRGPETCRRSASNGSSGLWSKDMTTKTKKRPTTIPAKTEKVARRVQRQTDQIALAATDATAKDKPTVPFICEGTAYTLELRYNGICMIEDEADMALGQFVDRLQKQGRMGDVLLTFHACLTRHHPLLSREDVSDLLEGVGPKEALDLIGEAFLRSPIFANARAKAA